MISSSFEVCQQNVTRPMTPLFNADAFIPLNLNGDTREPITKQEFITLCENT